jgi:tricarballylate dehydrogenase
VAQQEDQVAYVITDSVGKERYMPTAFPPFSSQDIMTLGTLIGLDGEELKKTVEEFNGHLICGDDSGLDSFNCHTEGLSIPKSHWATSISRPPFYAYRIRPGLTFTYMGLKIDLQGRIMTGDGPLENCYAAGEIASGNILKSGYLAGFGLTIGSTTAWMSAREIANAR